MRQSDSSDKPPVYDQNRISVHDCTSFRFSTFEDVPTVSLCEEMVPGTMYIPVLYILSLRTRYPDRTYTRTELEGLPNVPLCFIVKGNFSS